MGHQSSCAGASVVEVDLGEGRFAVALTRPHGARGLVLLAHGAGSDRRGPRSDLVAGLLFEHRLATLQFDLRETGSAETLVADGVAALGGRIVQVLDWAQARCDLEGLPVGVFAAGGGAAGALAAAAARPMRVAALVTRGGRPDLAADVLERVSAPAMLIVGGHDAEGLAHNRAALRRLTGAKRLEVVPRATDQFQEPWALVTAVELAAGWFGLHLSSAGRAMPPAAG